MEKVQIKYAVYFEQINQVKIVVCADSENSAREKAELQWEKEYARPICGDIEGVN